MEKFIPLNQTGTTKMRHPNKSGSAGSHHKQGSFRPLVGDKAAENKVNILQLYYSALIQCHSSVINKGNQDTSYLHCT